MASNQSKLKHSLPLLLALVVLISCLPVIPAAAADTFTASIIIDGAHNTLPCDSTYYYQMDVTSTGARFYNDFGSLTYTYNGVGEFLGFSRGGDTVVYSVGMSGVTMQGSVVELCAVSSFTTFITIDGTTYSFSSLTEKPSVTMAVTYSGAALSYGDHYW